MHHAAEAKRRRASISVVQKKNRTRQGGQGNDNAKKSMAGAPHERNEVRKAAGGACSAVRSRLFFFLALSLGHSAVLTSSLAISFISASPPAPDDSVKNSFAPTKSSAALVYAA